MHLVQQATIPPRRTWKENGSLKTFLRAVQLPWTLSDGVLPDALLRFINCRRRKIFGSVKLMKGCMLNNASQKEFTEHFVMHYLVRERQEEWLLAQLRNWQFTIPTTVVPVSPAKPKTIMICADQDFECFFWAASNGRELLEQTLPVSARIFRENRRTIRPAYTLEDILNEPTPVVEDRFTRMENPDG